MASIQAVPLCAIAGINFFAHVKIPKSRTVVWTLENTAHLGTLENTAHLGTLENTEHLGTTPEDGISVDAHVAEELRTVTDAVRLPKTNV